LFYRLCTPAVIEPFGPIQNCAEGNGVIPAAAFVGVVHDSNRIDTLTLSVDTFLLTQNFVTFTCYDRDSYDNCNGGTAPTTGGVIRMTWRKTLVTETKDTTSSRLYSNGVLTSSRNSSLSNFTAVQTGVVVGLAAKFALKGAR
jgi:hypothetical protein